MIKLLFVLFLFCFISGCGIFEKYGIGSKLAQCAYKTTIDADSYVDLEVRCPDGKNYKIRINK